MDAKANYPESQKPTWQRGSSLGMEAAGGALGESMCERASSGEPISVDAKANYPERQKPTWQCGSNPGMAHYCHVYKSQAKKSRCSRMSQATYIYSTVVDEMPLKKDTWGRRQKKKNKKQKNKKTV